MAMWSPWRGCRKKSEGCEHCYIHKAYAKTGYNISEIVKTDSFRAPVELTGCGDYKIKPGRMVYVCFSADFLIEEADPWRPECWDMIRQRPDLTFAFLTKRIERFEECAPPDWGEGYDNVIVGCTCENQMRADERLPIFSKLRIKHKLIILQPLISRVDIEKYLCGIEGVVLGGEQACNARPLDFDWVTHVNEQCARRRVKFDFRSSGTNFVKDGRLYTLRPKPLRYKR